MEKRRIQRGKKKKIERYGLSRTQKNPQRWGGGAQRKRSSVGPGGAGRAGEQPAQTIILCRNLRERKRTQKERQKQEGGGPDKNRWDIGYYIRTSGEEERLE